MTLNYEALKSFVLKHRHSVLFSATLLISMSLVTFFIISGGRAFTHAMIWIDQSNTIISKEQDLTLRIERMLSEEFLYQTTHSAKAKEAYEQNKAESSDIFAELNTLLQDDSSKMGRLKELQYNFFNYSALLDARITGGINAKPAKATGNLQTLRDNIKRIANDLRLQEQETADARTKNANSKRIYNRVRILMVSLASCLLFFFISLYSSRAIAQKDRVEKNYDQSQKLFRLTVEGISDGIFEWNLASGKATYSRQFWSMLGYQDEAFPDKIQSFRDLVHPEDLPAVNKRIESYLNGSMPEYLAIFRMKHRSGRWVWINARGKALYDETGQPSRLVGSHTDISHIKAYEERLEKAKESAEKANQAKTEFLAHMSHEIRTPLTAISGIAEIFTHMQSNLDDKQKKLIRTLNSSTSTLKDLVNDILDFSKIESEEMELECKKFKLNELFEEVNNIMSVKTGEKGLGFRFDYGPFKNREMIGDKLRLRQVLMNLVGNAVKFTHEGTIAVVCSEIDVSEQPYIRIEVRDTGIGIKPEHMDMIFERFKQADSSVSRKYGGTGLGLPISLRLARLMGGNIHAESAVGQGSVFTLTLPYHTDPAELSAVPTPAPARKKAAETIQAAGESSEPPDFSKKRILLVEDYEGNIVILGYLLDEMKCAYDVAHTGLEAVNMWSENKYDLVLMDVQMPEMDGFTATEQIRRLEQGRKAPQTPIIGMTAHALVGDKDKCIEAGMNAYLPKPIVESELKDLITSYLTQGSRKTAA